MSAFHSRSFASVLLAASVAFGTVAIAVVPRAKAETAHVLVGQNAAGAAARQFTPAQITITVDDTVDWQWYSYGERHTVTSYDESSPGAPDWASGGPTFDYIFSAPGTYTYYCSIHSFRDAAAPNTIDASIAAGAMVGKVIVQAPPTETPTSTNTPLATATATPTNTATATNVAAPVGVGGVADVYIGDPGSPAAKAGSNSSATDHAMAITLATAAALWIAAAGWYVRRGLRR